MMQNILLLPQLDPIPYTREKAIVVHLSLSDYLKVIENKLIEIPSQMIAISGERYKLVCGNNYAYYYLYCVISDYIYFVKTL